MASSTETQSGSPPQQEVMMDQKKRKRMDSNRESARRSRMRKQKLLDDLKAQAAQLSAENREISTRIDITSQEAAGVEAENSVLAAQVVELTHRLQSLNGILSCINSIASTGSCCMLKADEGFLSSDEPWNLVAPNNQHPIMASADVVVDY